MKKKDRFLIFPVIFFMFFFIKGLEAYQLYPLCDANRAPYMKKLESIGVLTPAAITKALELSVDESVLKVRERKDDDGFTSTRYCQTYKGLPIWGHEINIRTDVAGQICSLYGTLVLDIPADLDGRSLTIAKTAEQTLNEMKIMYLNEKRKFAKPLAKTVENATDFNFSSGEAHGSYIFANDNTCKAEIANLVSFYVDRTDDVAEPQKLLIAVNPQTGDIIKKENVLMNYDANGPGGNLKIGKKAYGYADPPFQVTNSGETCIMDAANVKTINLNHGNAWGTTVYSFPCPTNMYQEINGGYCPLNDAQYMGQVVFDTFKNWYNMTPLKGKYKLVLKVHYGYNADEAFWFDQGEQAAVFGDGYIRYYPLVCIDSVGHEVGHGITFDVDNSKLTYSGESGGINESFSDMAGEVCELYMKGSNDFMCSYEIWKIPGKARRYMYDPPLDGASIDNVNDYYDGMDVHDSSGIFNKAFYLLATTPGWTTRKAFAVFLKANQSIWTPSTTFQQGAEGARDAAIALGYPCDAVKNAFEKVGITITCSKSIIVLSPNGGESWNCGSTHDIQWTSINVNNVKIELLKAGVLVTTNLPSSLDASLCSYSWSIPDLAIGNDYKIRISDSTNLTASDASNDNFSIVAPRSITVTSPNGGESWIRGKTYSIQWTSKKVTNVKIQLMKGTSVTTIKTSASAASGLYNWPISATQTIGSNYKIRITDTKNPSVTDSSNTNFSIVKTSSSVVIKATAGAGGTITPSGNVTVIKGKNQTFTITANSGYKVQRVTVDGRNKGAITSYKFSNVQTNHTIAATFTNTSQTYYTVTVSAGAGGSITPGTSSYKAGSNASFFIQPASGYKISQILLDGANVSITNQSGQSVVINNIQANHTLSATFTNSTQTYTVTVTAGANGTITPGTSSYNAGANASFTIQPSAGYKISQIILDASSVAITNDAGQTVSINNIQANHTLSATFAIVPQRYTVTVSIGGSGTVTPGTSTYDAGANASFLIQPDTGNKIGHIVLDKVEIPVTNAAGQTVPINNIQANHTLLVIFYRPLVKYRIIGIIREYDPLNRLIRQWEQYNILVNEGDSYTITFSEFSTGPDQFFNNLIVDGSNKGNIRSWTFNNINSDHTVYANYKEGIN